ncbi:hypothetical protein CRENPOLYSF2_1380005 [Crenothrix polyspora]|uniref:Uncharacterized protein n=1 Tax=Crenothrix polyspora TaxID=360316 RepID=A0A1R4H0X3_9GAMM|nr:hypothetical protein CRENPOLYSF2_1380005 [Crenothrix polyspora]
MGRYLSDIVSKLPVRQLTHAYRHQPPHNISKLPVRQLTQRCL